MRRWRLAPRRKISHLGNGVDLQRFRPGSLGAGRAARTAPSVGRRRRDRRRRQRRATGRREGVSRAVRRRRHACRPACGWSSSAATTRTSPTRSTPRSLRRADDAGVVRLGHRDDVDRLLGAFDVFVLASHREGQPRAAMEAAAAGLPIVATDIRGCRQVVDHEVTGLLVPVADAAALADGDRATGRRSPERRRGDGRRRSAQGAAGVRRAARSCAGCWRATPDVAAHAKAAHARVADVRHDRSHPRHRRPPGPPPAASRSTSGKSARRRLLVGLRVGDVARPRRLVVPVEGRPSVGLEQVDQRQQVGACAEGEVHGIRIGHAPDDGVGEHGGHGVDEREVAALPCRRR